MVTRTRSTSPSAEHLTGSHPGRTKNARRCFNSGAEAVENAIKKSPGLPRKTAVVAFDHAYHGRTKPTMALTAKSMPYKSGFGPFAPEVYRAPMVLPVPRRPDRQGVGHRRRAGRERALTVIDKQIGAATWPRHIEPIQARAGSSFRRAGFLPTLRACCADNDVVFIADECCSSGFARTGLRCSPARTKGSSRT